MCREISSFTPENWNEVEATFSGCEAVELKHHWCENTDFEPESAIVKTGWRDGTFWVFTTLTDKDIINSASQMNELTYLHGDTFEMFLRDKRLPHYLELHVSPFNQRLQLRFAREGISDEINSQRELPYVNETIFQSWTQFSKAENQWRVLAAIPCEQLAADEAVGPGAEWIYSFGRYDYTSGEEHPVLSSTSAHQILDFHRQQEWNTLIFS